MDEIKWRRKLMASVKRLVIKVGSSLLTGPDGLDTRYMGRLAAQVGACHEQSRDIVIVTSGAIAAGFKKMGLTERPKTVRQQQACAAVGQAGLMMAWEKAFERRGHKVAQVLLTGDDLTNRQRYLNARNTLTTLIEWRVIPIINENDTVAVAELKMGDNDTVASLVTGLVGADLFINLTDIDGLYDRDPRGNEEAKFIPVVENVGAKVEAMASRTPGALGAGGMYTKILAARLLARQGIPSIIANGHKSEVLTRLLAGQVVGTMFLPRTKALKHRKHWIAFTAKPRGQVTIDDGARRAILKNGKSLLPPGIVAVAGNFHPGDSVRIVDRAETLVAVGLTNYSSEETLKIMGGQTGEIETRLGYKHSDEVVHRDNMVAGEDLAV